MRVVSIVLLNKRILLQQNPFMKSLWTSLTLQLKNKHIWFMRVLYFGPITLCTAYSEQEERNAFEAFLARHWKLKITLSYVLIREGAVPRKVQQTDRRNKHLKFYCIFLPLDENTQKHHSTASGRLSLVYLLSVSSPPAVTTLPPETTFQQGKKCVITYGRMRFLDALPTVLLGYVVLMLHRLPSFCLLNYIGTLCVQQKFTVKQKMWCD